LIWKRSTLFSFYAANILTYYVVHLRDRILGSR
jgi:hypothetical protein